MESRRNGSHGDESSSFETNGSSGETPDVLPGFKTMEDFVQSGFQAAMELTKMANALPSGHAWDLYSSYPSFSRIMDGEGNRLLMALSMALRHQGIAANVMRRDLEEKYDLIIDANDIILERVGCNLDELAGIRRNPESVLVEAVVTRPVVSRWDGAQLPAGVVNNTQPSGNTVRLLTARNIERPQAKFTDKIDNSTAPFEPIIKDKPHSLRPLAIMLEVTEDGERFSHPYEFELDRFQPRPEQLKKVVPVTLPPDVSNTPLIFVENISDVKNMLDDLLHCTELAVDLEHHSYRSYQGLTCLMQLSTRHTDYIVDTLALRSHLQPLNQVFTDPKIVKVFHGADMDIEWLQRDLGLYVVNMFDTHQAARVLGMARLSLAYLLQHYCDIVADKRYQLADWRIRPLPEELVKYAREDTHYLLYIYDRMKNELLDASNGSTNVLLSVIQHSTEICKKSYEKPVITEDSHLELYRRHKKLFDNRQMYALREIFHWRDKTARQEDESVGYVLPNHMMLQMAELLPREMQGILACCNPIPPLVRQHLNALHQIVLRAREQPLVRPVIEEERRLRPAAMARTTWDDPLLCPHDTAHAADARDDLPCLLNDQPDALLSRTAHYELASPTPLLTVFADFQLSEEDDKLDEIPTQAQQVHFMSPYARYCRVRPYTQQMEEEEEEAAAATVGIIQTPIKSEDDGNDNKFEASVVLDLVTPVKQEAPEDSVCIKNEYNNDSTVTDISAELEVPIKSDVSIDTTLIKPVTLPEKEVNDNSISNALSTIEQEPTSLQDTFEDTEKEPSRKRKHQNLPSDTPTACSIGHEDTVAGRHGKVSKKCKKAKNKKVPTVTGSTDVDKRDVIQDGRSSQRQKKRLSSTEHEGENTPTPPKIRQRGGRQRGNSHSSRRGAASSEPFEAFDYSNVDYEGRFKGGSQHPRGQNSYSRGKQGRRGKTRFTGRMNQKSMTFAKKLI